jgi:hypothetical protein
MEEEVTNLVEEDVVMEVADMAPTDEAAIKHDEAVKTLQGLYEDIDT